VHIDAGSAFSCDKPSENSCAAESSAPEYRIVVVGGGPLCTYAVGQLAALLPSSPPPCPVRIDIVDRSGCPGAGEVHSDRQAPTSYLNRVAGQIALAADESAEPPVKLLPRRLRPTFLEWCREQYAITGDPDYDLAPEDVPKRHVHGRALRDVFERVVEHIRAVPGVSAVVHVGEAVDLEPSGPDGTFVLHKNGGEPLRAHDVLFVTGHSTNRPAPGSAEESLSRYAERTPGAHWIGTPYPLAEQLDERVSPPGSTVILRGLGLSALDVMLHLTEGRGGRFVPDETVGEHGLRYVRSGREPESIVGTSPSGAPVWGRPVNHKVADPEAEHRGVFFTVEAVRQLRSRFGHTRASGGRRPLDFAEHLLPLVVLEMAYVYYATSLGPVRAAELRAGLVASHEAFLRGESEWGTAAADRLTALATQEARRAGHRGAAFDWRTALDPASPEEAGPDRDWHALVRGRLAADFARCREGNVRNPVKAAADGVWRDLRAVFSEAVDDGGLVARSHRDFDTRILRWYNRLSNGPGLEPSAKLLALVDAGLIDLAVGPEPRIEPLGDGTPGFQVVGRHTGVSRRGTTVVEARAYPFDPWLDSGPLYRNLLLRGLVRQWRNSGGDPPDYMPGALDLDASYHAVRRDGTVEPRMVFLGAPAEGLRVFQLTAARPHANSAVLNNAARWAEEVVARMYRAGAPLRSEPGMGREPDEEREPKP
jgi:hypothetical protein